MSRAVGSVPLVLLAAALGAEAAPKVKFVVGPGPTTISAEEAALAATGAGEHAVVLVDDTIRQDRTGIECEIEHHFRAKILTNEGRSLADVEIPGLRGYTSLRKWWGRVLLPDGKVLELSQEDLSKQTLVKSSLGEVESIKAALPGVVPGAVVDYGWTLRAVPGFYDRVELQGRYRVLSTGYLWRPLDLLPAGYRLSRSEGRQVETGRDPGGVWVRARDLPPIVEEPYMPPRGEVQTALHLYYGLPDDAADDYWGGIARRTESRVKLFNRPAVIRDAIARMALPAGAPLQDRLRAAYAWLDANVRRTDLRSAEELESADDTDPENAEQAKRVLASGEGTARDLDWLFVGIARELGASARLVYVADRTSNFFDPALRTVHQFSGTIVAVGAPEEPLDRWALVDPGSGLPYGEVPWYFTGISGFVATGKQADTVKIPPSPPARSVSSTTATLSFVDGNEAVVASWTRTAKGQHGFDERRHLRDLDPGERERRVRELCGEATGSDVLVAETPGLDQTRGPLELRCEFEREPGGLDERISRYSFPIFGPWFVWLPDFSDERRVHPIVFRFPRIDVGTITMRPPEGFEPESGFDPVILNGRLADYALTVETVDGAFKVSRNFVLKSLVVPPAEYAEFRAVLEKVRAADRASVTFRRAGAAR